MFNLDINKIGDQIAEKIKPILLEGKKQAELSLVSNIAAQLYSAEIMRGNSAASIDCIKQALNIIALSKLAIIHTEGEN
jgi:hypothetical protein